jgi:hypothetical protein
LTVCNCETKVEIAPDAEDRDKGAIGLCGKDHVCLIGDRVGNTPRFVVLGSYFGYSSNGGPYHRGLLVNVNKCDVGFLEAWGSFKHCVAECGIPLSDWFLSSGLFDTVADAVQELCQLLLARGNVRILLQSFRPRDVRNSPLFLLRIVERELTEEIMGWDNWELGIWENALLLRNKARHIVDIRVRRCLNVDLKKMVKAL